jgi:CysZ protein
VILADFLRALGQAGDARFRRVIMRGVLLAAAVLLVLGVAVIVALRAVVPDDLALPFIGAPGGVETLASWGAALVLAGLSVVLMVPVAAAMTGLFLDEVAAAVEARHYPALPPVPGTPMLEGLREAGAILGLLLGLNLLALLFLPFAGPFGPPILWALNGALIGREYFMQVAQRRMGRAEARALRRRHRVQIWAAGTLMSAALMVPVLNLAVPVLGAASFTHTLHRLARRGPGGVPGVSSSE